MTVLLLRLAGPLQAWGSSSRFVRRETGQEPSKSGVIGLLAAAQGRRRHDPIEDLASLRFGVRVDQPGRLVRDFQTARSLDGTRTMPLSYRYYLADAIFVAGIEADTALLHGLQNALRSPAYPLYLGRRSCPVTGQLDLGTRDGDLRTALSAEPWQASQWYRRTKPRELELTLACDDDPAAPTPAVELLRDHPLSFDPVRREYGWRSVWRGAIHMNNPDGRPPRQANNIPYHDPHAAL